MEIGIHYREGSFSDRWITYCKERDIDYKIVNCYDSDIIKQLKDCDVLLWHHHHGYYKDVLAAKRILFALEHAGVKVYPNFSTGWHFDDKVAQKYLLEAIEAPIVPSYVFYDKTEALNWAMSTSYPKVFKLRGGAGSSNVFLIENKKKAKKYIRKMFSSGMKMSPLKMAGRNFKGFLAGRNSFYDFAKYVGLFLFPKKYEISFMPKEKGYVYFQDFIPNNKFDTRVVVINGRAIAERRMVVDGDFRASGSGIFNYDEINLDAVQIALEVSEKLKLQSCAYDFVIDNNNPLIVEMSYAFGVTGIKNAPGYWDSSLKWHETSIDFQEWILESLITSVD
ncbi:hypothetical protein QYZ87_04190 [Porphyromonadaceae bacterium W3.11]|nr:hypothetical protein [Porphyromonadaceae bacterium W3.11]